jgi:hypothetical protein
VTNALESTRPLVGDAVHRVAGVQFTPIGRKAQKLGDLS